MRIVSLDRERTRPEEKCGGCRLCESICVLVHQGVGNPKRSRIRIWARYLEDHQLVFDEAVCHQCVDEAVPPCAQACPSEAISRDPVSGIWQVNREECAGCGVCADECPYGAIFIDPVDMVALKCDLCGGHPQCVDICPAQVLTIVEQSITPRLEAGGLGEKLHKPD